MIFAFVIFDGLIGGAERLSVALAAELQGRGIPSSVVVIGEADELRPYLVRHDVRYVSGHLRPGSQILQHPRTFAAAVQATGATVAILDSFGYEGAALRIGGFKGHIIGVEHGALANLGLLRRHKRLIRLADRASGLRTNDAEVAVSKYMERVARKSVHHRRLFCVPNGVRVPPSLPLPATESGCLTIGYVGRLAKGKGVPVLLRAMAHLRAELGAMSPVLTIAGDGPDRKALGALWQELQLQESVRFLGWIDDVKNFWANCDLSVVPSDTWKESFCLSAVEAMMYGRAAVVTDRGALPELVEDGVSGTVVVGGQERALAQALCRYARDPEMVATHGRAARERVRTNFSLKRCADGYLEVAASLPPRQVRAGPLGWRR